MKQIIYFIRHGETILNAQGIRQGSEGSLSQQGIAQTLDIARRFPKKHGKPHVILSSPYQRTMETSKIIASELEIDVDDIKYSDLLKERRNPTEIIGRSGKEEKVKMILDIIDKSFHDDNFRYSDEENFIDLKKRAKKVLKYIARQNQKRIIVVTHGIFLKVLASYITIGDSLTSLDYEKLSIFNHSENASLTVVTHVPHWFKKDEWEILVWNSVMGDNYVENENKTVL